MTEKDDFSAIERFLLEERKAKAGPITAQAGSVFTFLVDQLIEINQRGVTNERELRIYEIYLSAAQGLWRLFEPFIPEEEYKEWGRNILMPLHLQLGGYLNVLRGEE